MRKFTIIVLDRADLLPSKQNKKADLVDYIDFIQFEQEKKQFLNADQILFFDEGITYVLKYRKLHSYLSLDIIVK